MRAMLFRWLHVNSHRGMATYGPHHTGMHGYVAALTARTLWLLKRFIASNQCTKSKYNSSSRTYSAPWRIHMSVCYARLIFFSGEQHYRPTHCLVVLWPAIKSPWMVYVRPVTLCIDVRC